MNEQQYQPVVRWDPLRGDRALLEGQQAGNRRATSRPVVERSRHTDAPPLPSRGVFARGLHRHRHRRRHWTAHTCIELRAALDMPYSIGEPMKADPELTFTIAPPSVIRSPCAMRAGRVGWCIVVGGIVRRTLHRLPNGRVVLRAKQAEREMVADVSVRRCVGMCGWRRDPLTASRQQSSGPMTLTEKTCPNNSAQRRTSSLSGKIVCVPPRGGVGQDGHRINTHNYTWV